MHQVGDLFELNVKLRAKRFKRSLPCYSTRQYCCQVGARCLETSVWGAYHNVAINLEGLTDTAAKGKLQAEMEEAVRVAQDGLQMVLSTLTHRKQK